jgi:hypothetical protein
MKRLLLLSFILVLAQAGRAQLDMSEQVSIYFEGVTLEEALYQITDQVGVKISFGNSILPEKKINQQFTNKPLSYILEQLFRETPIEFRQLGNQIALYADEKSTVVISGFLTDAQSGEALLYANILDLESRKGTASNAYGFFSLTVPKGKIRLAFSYTGYKTEWRELELTADNRLDLELQPSLTFIKPVVIVGQKDSELANPEPRAGETAINIKQVESLPALAGETDIIRITQLLPGVQTGTDGVGGLHIRGGSNGQNLILIDGVPVYNISHAAGLFSVFNTSAIRSTNLYKGAFPARYGGRLSSVIDIATKEGNRKKLGVQGELGTLAGRLTVDGPIVKDRSSFFLSGRLSLVDWYLEPITRNLKSKKGEDGFIDYRFYDFNAKLNYNLSRKDKLYLSFYSGADFYKNRGLSTDSIQIIDNSVQEPSSLLFEQSYSDKVSWGNVVGSLRWNHLFSNRLFANLSATYSSLNVNIDYQAADSLTHLSTNNLERVFLDYGYYESQIEDLGLRLDFDFMPTPDHYIRFGANITHHFFRPGVLSYNQNQLKTDNGNFIEVQQSSNTPVRAIESAFYIEDDFQINDQLSVNAGLHNAIFYVNDKWYASVQPRLLLNYQFMPRWKLEAFYGQSTQFIHLLSNSLLGLPTELWVPSTPDIAPQQAWQTGLTSRWKLDHDMELSLDLYYKSMKNLLSYSEGAAFLDDWEANVTAGNGEAYGAELLLQKRIGRFSGWLGYGLQWADRQFPLLNRGERYPYRYDRRHEVKAAVVHRIENWLELTASWTLSSGFAFSLPLSQYTVNVEGVGPVTAIDYGTKNAYRMPYYHRLDFSANIYIDMEKTIHKIKMGAYNLYNRQNPLYFDIRTTGLAWENGAWAERKELVKTTLVPLLPSLSYSIEF